MYKRQLFDGKTATGVEFVRRGTRMQVHAAAEVVLAAGAINSPQILQRSGIGPGKVLQAAGVNPLVDRAGVGANLQDHLEVYFQIACLQPITLCRLALLRFPFRMEKRHIICPRQGLAAQNMVRRLFTCHDRRAIQIAIGDARKDG